jgi:hypothetical protein
MANDDFRARLDAKLDTYREWFAKRKISNCRLVQFCGVEMIGALDIPLSEIQDRIEGLLCEGFYVDWAEDRGRLYLRVWEYGGPEPDWPNVFREESLTNLN